MGKIRVTKCPIEGLLIIEPEIFGDERGYFMETYNKKDFEEAGLFINFVQDNQSMSTKGVLRGLHYQKKHSQGKLVRVISGKVYDVAVDIRRESNTFGKWYGITLSSDNRKQFYIPEGFAHGFLVLSESALFSYKCTNYYHPEDESGIIWNDENLGIEWPEIIKDSKSSNIINPSMIDGTLIKISEKDKKWGTLRSIDKY